MFTTKSDGRIRAYDTRTAQMRVLYEPGQDPEILGPDNITFALNGDLYVCEDTPADQDLLLFGADGTRTQVLRLDASHAGSELAGVAFDPSGTRMYISSQRGGGGDGVTYEISGPFRTLAVPATSTTDAPRSTAANTSGAAQRTSRRHRRRPARRHLCVARGRCGRRCGSARARRAGVAAHAPGYDTGVTLFPGPSLDELRDAVDRCTACDLYKEATQAVFGEGPRDAALMLMGEVPGDKEDLAGHPFVGPAGKVLDEALADVGIDRAQMYLTNAVKHFKFERRGKVRIHKKPNAAEIARVQPVVAGRARGRCGPTCSASSVRPRVTRSSAPSFRVTKQRGEWLAGAGRHRGARDDPSLGSVASPARAAGRGVRGSREGSAPDRGACRVGRDPIYGKRLADEAALLELRLDVVAVHQRDEVDRDRLRARGLALAVVRARAEVRLHRLDHRRRVRSQRSAWPCGNRLRCCSFADVNSCAAPFGHAATHAPQPMHAAASIAASATGFGIGIEVAVGRAAGADADVAARLDDAVERAAVDDEVADEREARPRATARS